MSASERVLGLRPMEVRRVYTHDGMCVVYLSRETRNHAVSFSLFLRFLIARAFLTIIREHDATRAANLHSIDVAPGHCSS